MDSDRADRPTASSQPYAVCGYEPGQHALRDGIRRERAAQGGHQRPRDRPWRSPTPTRRRRLFAKARRSTRPGATRASPLFKPGQFSQIVCPANTHFEHVGPVRTRRAGTARRRSTSRPCTRWRPAPRSSSSGRSDCLGRRWTRRWADDDRQPRRRRDHQLLDRRHRTTSPCSAPTTRSPTSSSRPRRRSTGITVNFSSGDDGDHRWPPTWTVQDGGVPGDRTLGDRVGGTSVVHRQPRPVAGRVWLADDQVAR